MERETESVFIDNVTTQIDLLNQINEIVGASKEDHQKTMDMAFEILDASRQAGDISQEDWQAATDLWLDKYSTKAFQV